MSDREITFKITTVYRDRRSDKWADPGVREHIYHVSHEIGGHTHVEVRRSGDIAWTPERAEADRKRLIELLDETGRPYELI